MDLIVSHSWPGNIRELENVIEHAFVIESRDEIQSSSLPASVSGSHGEDADGVTEAGLEDADGILPESLEGAPLSIETGFRLDINHLDFQANKEEFERQFLISALKAFNGRINQTAMHANIPKKTLLRKLEKYGIRAREYSRQD